MPGPNTLFIDSKPPMMEEVGKAGPPPQFCTAFCSGHDEAGLAIVCDNKKWMVLTPVTTQELRNFLNKEFPQ